MTKKCAHEEVVLHDADKLWHCTWCDETFSLTPTQSEPKAPLGKVPPYHEWDEHGKCKWCPAIRK